jgi:lysylphosphatidylglycerol synthetase-like protein (DUF2156 family)
MERIRFIDIVHLLGSVASITGISLLWLKSELNIKTILVEIPVLALLISFSLGIISVGIILLRYLYQKYFINKEMMWKFAFFALSIPTIALIIGFFIFVIWSLVWFELLRPLRPPENIL